MNISIRDTDDIEIIKFRELLELSEDKDKDIEVLSIHPKNYSDHNFSNDVENVYYISNHTNSCYYFADLDGSRKYYSDYMGKPPECFETFQELCDSIQTIQKLY